ncbi:unnamed protein product [Debaryomyces tyrocola]|nr:unnamed protein product [Debaryomyces tyrocola]
MSLMEADDNYKHLKMT